MGQLARPEEGGPLVSAEAMAKAVLAQAWRDAFRIGQYDKLTPLAQEEAWTFLTADAGEWRRSRETWCEAAGHDAGALRREALAREAEYRAMRPTLVATQTAERAKRQERRKAA